MCSCRFLIRVERDKDVQDEGFLIHDESSFLICSGPERQHAYNELGKIVKPTGGNSAAATEQNRPSVHMWCKRISKTALRVYLEGMPAQPPNWRKQHGWY